MSTNAPMQMHMDKLAGPAVQGHVIKQHTSECCRCCCCQPNIHWRIHEFVEDFNPDMNLNSQYWIQENATWCGRTCSFVAPGFRPTTYKVFDGQPGADPNAPKDNPIMTHEKPTTCGVNLFIAQGDGGQIRIPMCCNLPYLTTKDSQGKVLGHTRYLCDGCLCVPKFAVEDEHKKEIYRIRPDTCCGGCCVQCKCGTKKCLRIPYYIRDPTSHEKLDDAQIVDLWAGFKHECCTMKNAYKIKYPKNAPENVKATLIGSSLLIDITMVEQDQS